MKKFVALIVIVLLAAVIWTGGWYYIAGQVRAEIEHLATADAVTTPRVECTSLDVSGFPFHFSPICGEAVITSGDLRLTIGEVRATALFYRPTHLQIFAAAPARLDDAFTGSAHEVSWENLRASLRLDGDRLARFSLLADDLVHNDALFGATELSRAGHLELHLIDATASGSPQTDGATLDIFARIEGARVQGFDISNGTASLDARITALPPLNLLSHPQALRLWQSTGGELELRQIEAHADGLEARASGEGSLDDTGRINAVVALSSRGLVERFPGAAEDPVAAMFLGMPDAEGTYSQSLSVRGGTLFVGILPVTSIAPLF